MSDEQKYSEHCQVVRGFPFPNVSWMNSKNIDDALDYIPKDDDVIIASYPKTGSTWLKYTVLQIVSRGELFPAFDDSSKYVPFLEMSGIAAVEALESNPRIYRHHIAYNMVQKNDKAKYIYIYRHPEDAVVSSYYFMKSLMKGFQQVSFDIFFDVFLSGDIAYGNYFKHVLSFYKHREDDNLLMVSYEKLHADRKKEILRIAKFLGEKYFQSLLENEDILNKIIKHTSFDYMKKNLYFTNPDSRRETPDTESDDRPKVDFFREGIVGDGKSILTSDQRRILKETAQKIMKGTTILDEWY